MSGWVWEEEKARQKIEQTKRRNTMLTTKMLIDWIKTRTNPVLNTVEEDYASECVQRLREYSEVRDALMKIVTGFEELEAIYLEKEV